MIGGIKYKQIREIRSITKKLRIDKSKLPLLLKAQKEGRSDEEVIGELLNIPEGVDAKTYLKETLNDQEFAVLQNIIANYTNGSGKNPLE